MTKKTNLCCITLVEPIFFFEGTLICHPELLLVPMKFSHRRVAQSLGLQSLVIDCKGCIRVVQFEHWGPYYVLMCQIQTDTKFGQINMQLSYS